MNEKLKFLETFLPADLIPVYQTGILSEEREPYDKEKYELLNPALQPLARLIIKPVLEKYLKTDPTENFQFPETLLSGSAINDWVEIIDDEELTKLWNDNEMARSMGNIKDLGFF